MMRLYPDEDEYHRTHRARGIIGVVLAAIAALGFVVTITAETLVLILPVTIIGGAATYFVYMWGTWRENWDDAKRHPLRYENGRLTWREFQYPLSRDVRALSLLAGRVRIVRGSGAPEPTAIPGCCFDPDALNLFLHEAIVRYALQYNKRAVARIERFETDGPSAGSAVERLQDRWEARDRALGGRNRLVV